MLSCARSRSRDARLRLLVECALHVASADDRALGLGRPAVRLGQQIADLIDQQRQLAGVIGQTRGMLDHQRHAIAIDRA